MSAKVFQFTITTTPSIIVAADNAAEQINLHAVGECYIGVEGLTTANGFLLDNKDKVTLQNDGNALYAVTSAGTAVLYVLAIQK